MTADADDAAAFGALAVRLLADATSVLDAGYGIAGEFGRYATVDPSVTATSETLALAAATASRAAVAAASAALAAVVSVAGDVPLALQRVLDAMASAIPSPGQRIRALSTLAGTSGSSDLAGLARRLAVIATAMAALDFTPDSYDQAQSLLAQLADLLDREVTAAGDGGDDPSFAALRALRSASVADLTARGADLAPLRTFTFGASMPAVTVAAILYGDATRADELVRRVDPPHPLFMPPVITVLAS